MQAVSTATVTHYVESAMSIFSDTPTTDLYNSVFDVAAFVFADEDGTETTVYLPAPSVAIFLGDLKTINMDQANVSDFIDQAFNDLIVPSSGKPVVNYVGGELRRNVIE